jgi:hypothetical protein
MSSGKHVIEITIFSTFFFLPVGGGKEEEQKGGQKRERREAKAEEKYTATSISIITGWKRRLK